MEEVEKQKDFFKLDLLEIKKVLFDLNIEFKDIPSGNEIYCRQLIYLIISKCWYDYEKPNYDMTGIVEFTEGWMSYWIADYDKKEFSELNGQGYCHWTIEVIYNIYDNPELMEGEL